MSMVAEDQDAPQVPVLSFPDRLRVQGALIAQADAVAAVLCDGACGHVGPGTYRTLTVPEQRPFFLDALACIRGRSLTARQVAVTRAAEGLYMAAMSRRNLTHLIDWQNTPQRERSWWIAQAAGAVSIFQRSLEGLLDPQGSR